MYSSKEDWWGSNSDVASEFGTEYATGYNNFPNRYASYGLRHNLENISYVKEENKTASQIKSPTRWKNMIIGNSIDGNGENNTLGTVFRANNMNNNILNVRMLTLEELNEKINEIDESNNRERLSVTSLPKDTKYGIFNFTDISNYAFSYEVSYGLASPCTITNQVSTTNKCIHYVQLRSKTSITIWQTQTNDTSLDCMGLRPVIVLSSKIQLIDTDGDGVLEIK